MTICFKGNQCKYEIEAIMKLFLPIVTFDFLFEETVSEGDFCIISSENSGDKVKLDVIVSYNGAHIEKTDEISADDDTEQGLCRLLYHSMHEITGVTPEWGMLTGIRPVKKVNALLDEGLDKDRIFHKLKEKYEVSDRKLELAYQTAVTQKK